MPALQMAYTDRYGAVHPAALFVIHDVKLQLVPPSAEYQLDVYVDQAAKDAGKPALEERIPVAFTEDEIAALQGQFAVAVYQTLQGRAEFTGAALVA